MSQFIQLHTLVSYPPSNLNRDDLGRPKTAIMGGVQRLRVSSQSLKRAWRTSALFADLIGVRTKQLGVEVEKALKAKGISDKNARDWAAQIAAVYGAVKKTKPRKSNNWCTSRPLNAPPWTHWWKPWPPKNALRKPPSWTPCCTNSTRWTLPCLAACWPAKRSTMSKPPCRWRMRWVCTPAWWKMISLPLWTT